MSNLQTQRSIPALDVEGQTERDMMDHSTVPPLPVILRFASIWVGAIVLMLAMVR